MEQLGMQVAAALATKAVTSLFGGDSSPSSPAPPSVSAPATTAPTPDTPQIDMPTASSSTVTAAKRRSISAQIARRGRASTILTDLDTEKLGG